MERSSRRIEFDQSDLDFLKELRESSGITIQTFVEDLVKAEIRRIKADIEINNLKLSNNAID